MTFVWSEDKIAHYKYCYKCTSNAKSGFTFLWGLIVFISVSVWKELYNDWLMGRGTPEWGDVKANYFGCKDAWEGKASRF